MFSYQCGKNSFKRSSKDFIIFKTGKCSEAQKGEQSCVPSCAVSVRFVDLGFFGAGVIRRGMVFLADKFVCPMITCVYSYVGILVL